MGASVVWIRVAGVQSGDAQREREVFDVRAREKRTEVHRFLLGSVQARFIWSNTDTFRNGAKALLCMHEQNRGTIDNWCRVGGGDSAF